MEGMRKVEVVKVVKGEDGEEKEVIREAEEKVNERCGKMKRCGAKRKSVERRVGREERESQIDEKCVRDGRKGVYGGIKGEKRGFVVLIREFREREREIRNKKM